MLRITRYGIETRRPRLFGCGQRVCPKGARGLVAWDSASRFVVGLITFHLCGRKRGEQLKFRGSSFRAQKG